MISRATHNTRYLPNTVHQTHTRVTHLDTKGLHRSLVCTDQKFPKFKWNRIKNATVNSQDITHAQHPTEQIKRTRAWRAPGHQRMPSELFTSFSAHCVVSSCERHCVPPPSVHCVEHHESSVGANVPEVRDLTQNYNIVHDAFLFCSYGTFVFSRDFFFVCVLFAFFFYSCCIHTRQFYHYRQFREASAFLWLSCLSSLQPSTWSTIETSQVPTMLWHPVPVA